MAEAAEAIPISICPRCGCAEFFTRKDFPQKVGIAIVIGAGAAFLILAASRQRFYLGVLVLVAALLVDLLLYAFVRTITVCYRCRAEFRGIPLNPKHGPYELAVGEKFRGGGGVGHE